MKIKLILSIMLFLSLASIHAFAQTKIAPKITAIHAKLFQDATGNFSEDILEIKEPFLFNTIIGEGTANGEPSTSTFITVEISGKNVPVGSLKIEITATGNKGRLIQKKIIGVEIYDERTKFFAPLWLYDTGCEQITISARLIGKGAPIAPVKKKIAFRCGE